MKVFVTGAAGFIGSWVAETLLSQGHDVLGIDCFLDFYPRSLKEQNIKHLRQQPSFRFVEADLNAIEESQLMRWLEEYPWVVHEAGQAGVRSSWGKSFEPYVRHNILATQRLLELARQTSVRRFVYASSSSVYGEATTFPLREDAKTVPVSPYGVTKLAGENLVLLYHQNFGVPTISLRYFTVYGPRQRPDMGFHRMIASAFSGKPFQLYGDGSQVRQATHVKDVVQATLQALFFKVENTKVGSPLGKTINIGGRGCITMEEVIQLVQELTGMKLHLEKISAQKGDVSRTEADIALAKALFDYNPRVNLREGLESQIDWQKASMSPVG